MKIKITLGCTLVVISGIAAFAIAQPPPRRTHRIVEKGVLKPRPAISTPEVANEVTIEVEGNERIIRSNGIPNHKTAAFPNSGNPNRISAQAHEYRVPANPKVADRVTPMHGMFGVAINGVPFDPGAGEFYEGEAGWQYEPLSGAIDLGIDVSHAHVQPTGKYHYHGLPTGLLDSVKVQADQHSPLIGWAADGFPMYAVYGYSDPKDKNSDVQNLASSYQLKAGDRPGGNAPGGKYDGTFVADYEYVEGSGDLDECNGRFTVTPDYPDGIYGYFMTEQWPVVPRMYRGTPSVDFRHGPPGGSGGGSPGSSRQHDHDHGPPSHERPSHGNASDESFHDGPPHHQRVQHERQQPVPRPDGPPRPGTILPRFILDSLDLTAEQREELTTLQQTVDDRLKEILTDDQQSQLRHAGPHGPGHQGAPPPRHEAGGRGPDGSRSNGGRSEDTHRRQRPL